MPETMVLNCILEIFTTALWCHENEHAADTPLHPNSAKACFDGMLNTQGRHGRM